MEAQYVNLRSALSHRFMQASKYEEVFGKGWFEWMRDGYGTAVKFKLTIIERYKKDGAVLIQ
ncbi:hypothetical protein BZK31_19110 [Pseudomonas floridensis]|uniref:Uncharacterized protein n=1 Tax=Pseudomonas floridensis TaxID=1958950 RepID=A0A1X0N2C8_9PSED|nr:hypothetical protein BZK31_19110 [Pseudomonas floridensis]